MLKHSKNITKKMENQLGQRLKVSRPMEKGTTLHRKAFRRYLTKHRIIRETPALYSFEQNGINEHANRTIMERVKAIIAKTDLLNIVDGDCTKRCLSEKQQSYTNPRTQSTCNGGCHGLEFKPGDDSGKWS